MRGKALMVQARLIQKGGKRGIVHLEMITRGVKARVPQQYIVHIAQEVPYW
jgi:hypothetical protein